MKKRIISAACLIPLLILLLDAAPQWSTMVLCILISVIAAYELMKNTGLIQSRRMRGYTYIAAGLIPIGCYFHSSIVGFQMLMLLLCVFLFSEAMLSKGEISHLSIDVCLVAGLMLPFIFSGLIRLSYSDMGKVLVLIPFTIAFTADAGAYFTGIACGKHHFAPTVSPHKTSEGVFGGTTCCVIGMLIFAFIFNITNTQIKASYFAALLYGLLGSFAATFGDLCFSYIKRQVSIKDYGNLIPGHGGILDRFDSISAVLVLTEILINRFPIIG